MNETAHLRIQVSDGGVESATRNLRRLERQSNTTQRATSGLGRAAMKAGGALAAAFSAGAALRKLTETARSFDVINASLITSTGSAENAKIAFDALLDFATTTPYQLDTVANSFIKLVNYGLTPSEQALNSYGNTAAAMGKDLEQLVEAVADAATGEFERLKEFGIKSANEGDQIAFRFRGVTTRVKNNAEEIENYIIGLGENEFAGAMQQRMDTLDGAMSNLADSWNKLFLTISNAGAGDLIEASVRRATSALEEMTAIIESGQLGAAIDFVAFKFRFLGDGATAAYNWISQGTSELANKLGINFEKVFEFILEGFRNMPENIAGFVLIMVEHFQSLPRYAEDAYNHISNILYNYGEWMVDRAVLYGKQIRAALTFDGGALIDLDAEVERIESLRNNANRSSLRRMNESMGRESDATASAIQGIRDRHAEWIAASDEQLARIGMTREAYNQMMDDRAAQTGDRLKGFGVGGTSDDAEDPAAAKAAAKAAKRRADELQSIQDYLYTEEEAIKASYDRRREIVLANTSEEGTLREELLSKLSDKYAEETATLRERQMADVEALRESLYSEEEAVEASYQRRRDIILENTRLTGEEKRELETKLEEHRASALQKIEADRQREQLRATSDFFGNLSVLQQSENKKMAAIGKAAAIAQATIRTYESATSAYSAMAGIPVVGPALGAAAAAAAVAAGLANVAQIKSTNAYAGAYDKGGHIPAGQYGLVGEVGPELVRGPANVTGREDTAKLRGGSGSLVIQFSPQVTIEGGSGGNMDQDTAQRFGDQINERMEHQFMQLLHREMGPNGILDRWRA